MKPTSPSSSQIIHAHKNQEPQVHSSTKGIFVTAEIAKDGNGIATKIKKNQA
jgi:hypothetical protein